MLPVALSFANNRRHNPLTFGTFGNGPQLKPDINEADLRRTPNTSMTKEELPMAVNDAMHASSPSSPQNVLKLGGPLVDEIIEFVQRVSLWTPCHSVAYSLERLLQAAGMLILLFCAMRFL